MNATSIQSVTGRRIWDSRGNPTVEVEIGLENGVSARGVAPAGASRGAREAVDLRDGGDRLGGMGVARALKGVKERIAPALIGLDARDQKAADDAILALDPTPAKDRLGGNAAVAASLAVLRAGAAGCGIPVWKHVAELYGTEPSIPLPEIQIFGGGAHAGRRVDIQDFMVMVPGAANFDEVMEITHEIYRAAGALMKERGKLAGVADEGGWWPDFASNEEALETLVLAIEKAGEKPGGRVVISLDVAASEFRHDGGYRLALEDRDLSSEQMIDMLQAWLNSYPIASVEDPLGEDDPEGMRAFTEKFGDKLQIIGDDYLVTNCDLVNRAATEGVCNAVLIKVNQAGTVSEAVAAFQAARDAGWTTIVSARSGETEDVAISHLAVGLGAGQLKVGSFSRSERMAKWNECVRIEEALGADTFVAGIPLHRTWWAEAR